MMKRLSAFWAGNTERISGIFFTLAGIAVAIVAQVTLNLSNEELSSFWNVGEWWDTLGSNGSPLAGLLLYALAGALFILGLRGLGETPAPLPISIRLPEQRRPRFGLWFTSMGLTGLVAAYTIQPQMDNSFALSALWVLSIGLLVASALIDENWQPPSRSQMRKWLSVHRAEILVIFTILVAAFFIRFLDVELHPYSFVNEEGPMGNGGRCIIQGDCAN